MKPKMNRPAWLATLLLSIAMNLNARDAADNPSLTLDDLRTFSDVFNQIRNNYVSEVDEQELLRAAIKGMVSTLDPWSQFFTAEEFHAFDDNSSGRYGGTGIQIRIENQRLLVENVVRSSPADFADIQQDDLILAIDGRKVRGRPLSESMDALLGEPGTTVVIRLKSAGQPARDVELERQFIAVPSVEALILTDHVAYFKISQFTQTTEREFRDALDVVTAGRAAPLGGVILDLRNNRGGVIKPAIDIADGFLADGMIVYTQSRYEATRLEIVANPGEWLADVPVVILINEHTASAAEVLAGAMKDRQRATLVGNRTFGKGSIQSLLKLRNGSALKLTTAHYFTPSGAVIHQQGIEPDITIEDGPESAVSTRAEDDSPRSGGHALRYDPYVTEALRQLGA